MSEIEAIIREIEEIQKQPFQNSISAMGRQLQVEKLHEKLNALGYTGPRPPLRWSQLDKEGKCYHHPQEITNAAGKCKLCEKK